MFCFPATEFGFEEKGIATGYLRSSGKAFDDLDTISAS